MYELYGKSKEQPMPVINIKALLFSVSFESQTGLHVQLKHSKLALPSSYPSNPLPPAPPP